MAKPPCSVDRCPREVVAKGWCRTHYGRWYRHGDPLYTVKPSPRFAHASIFEILGNYVDATGDCWVWTGTITSNGYGQFWLDGERRSAHRWVWEALVGEISDGLAIDHLCRVTYCVNPDHLEPVTVAENTARGFGTSGKNGRKRRCLRGHLLVGENLYVRSSGKRECRACRRVPG